jgi:hypothetical protein
VEFVLFGCLAAAAAAWFGWRRRRRRPTPVAIDPFTVGEPWRRSVAAAQSAQRRYGEIVGATRPGPLRDRLQTIGAQVQRAVEDCWRVAQRGDELDDTLQQLRVRSLSEQRERAADAETRASLDRQLGAVDRIAASRDDTDRTLRLLTTRLGELVTHAAEIAVAGDSADDFGVAVDEVVTQLEALRLAVEDVNRPDGSAGQVQTAQ